MKQNRRSILRMLLCSPMAILGLKADATAGEESSGMVMLRPHCGICGHYVPLREMEYCMIDGPPSAYCRHPAALKGNYLSDDAVYRLGLHREPGDCCELFSLREIPRPVDSSGNECREDRILRPQFVISNRNCIQLDPAADGGR